MENGIVWGWEAKIVYFNTSNDRNGKNMLHKVVRKANLDRIVDGNLKYTNYRS
jgi:hypothetical protein